MSYNEYSASCKSLFSKHVNTYYQVNFFVERIVDNFSSCLRNFRYVSYQPDLHGNVRCATDMLPA
jgi:hypothetical protein